MPTATKIKCDHKGKWTKRAFLRVPYYWCDTKLDGCGVAMKVETIEDVKIEPEELAEKRGI